MSTLRLVMLGVAALLVILATITYGVDKAVENAIFRESVDKATRWANYLTERIPDIEPLAETGLPNAEQHETMAELQNLGDIFRFKLFTPDGRLSLISDASTGDNRIDASDITDQEPKQVAATGLTIVELFDGTQKSNRPDLYAKAFVPLLAEDGRVRAIVEVYVDQTATQSYFKESFRPFGVLLAVLGAAFFIAPSLAFYIQRKMTQRSQNDAEFYADFDPLTGLMNRRKFTTQAESSIAANKLKHVCYLDLDHFKAINDTYGHAVGDAFLAQITKILRENCGDDALISRFGGDEFVIGYHDNSVENTINRAKALLQMCSNKIDVNNITINGSVSIGIAEVKSNETLEEALQNADTALYHAKSSGRNTLAIYDPEMGEELKKQYALEARIREAVEHREFQIYYQPLVCSQDKCVIGHEALLRLFDKEGRFIPPSVFVPIAENLGLIDEIGRWTIKTAINCVATGDNEKIIAINLSSLQFKSGDLVNTVHSALSDANLPASQLELEITESLVLEDSPFVGMQIDALRDMGVRIAMDDFGTGFSSLSYLWKYGFDRLKIDRSFVAALDENPERSREIIESVVMLGSKLNMKITAEGVETCEQSRFLEGLGCDTLQGYLYGKPAPYGVQVSSQDGTNSSALRKAC